MCKNSSTKRPLDRYNSILTTLSDFFSTKVQTFSLSGRFEVKKTICFLKGRFAFEMFRWTTKMQFWKPYWVYCKTIQSFFDQSPKMRKTKNKMFEKSVSSNCQSGHTECHFKEPVRVFPMKVGTVFDQIPIKEQAQTLPGKKSSKCFSGHMKCNFDMDVRSF